MLDTRDKSLKSDIQKIINQSKDEKDLKEFLESMTCKQLKHLCYSLPILNKGNMISGCGTKDKIVNKLLGKFTYDDIINHISDNKNKKYFVICGGDKSKQCTECLKYTIPLYCSKCNSMHGYYTNDKKSSKSDNMTGDRIEIRNKRKVICDICTCATNIDEYENAFYESDDTN
jgi:hypothetical protein